METPQKKGVENTSQTWACYYKDRVGNMDYLNAFTQKYRRFLEEIIRQIKRLTIPNSASIILKEEGCGIGTICQAISTMTPGTSKDSKVEKIIYADAAWEMLDLCRKNNKGISPSEYLSGATAFYAIEDIRCKKFFEKGTIIMTHGVLEHFTDQDIEAIINTYNDCNVAFQAHYVPTDLYQSPSFGDERLLPVQKWIDMVRPDYYMVDNACRDLYMFKFGKLFK